MVMLNMSRLTHKTRLLGLVGLLLAVLGCVATVEAVARGYKSNDPGIRVGMVVSLVADDPTKVERTSSKNQSLMIGVAVSANETSVTVINPGTDLLAESEGEVEVYVSDLNGPVKKGDVLAVSPIKGVLVRATPDYSFLAGIATSDMREDATTYELDDNGTKINTKLGFVTANLNRKGAQGTTKSNPSSLSSLGESLTGKNVSPVRVIVGLVLFIVVLIIEGGIIYGAVSSSITALGRNPLARAFIQSELKLVASLAFGVLVLGLAAVYAILWL